MVRGALGFMGVVIGALGWQRKVVLSVWVGFRKSGFMGWLSVHCVSRERWFLAYGWVGAN